MLGFESEKYIIIQILSRKLSMDKENCLSDKTNGRWTKQQHQNFILGLKMHGKNWRKIQELVVTRNGSQIRSHAQKYFMKLASKSIQLDQTIQNKDPDSLTIKQKEITSKNSNKKYKIPSLNSPSFWQQISQLVKIPSFCFWDYIQLSQPHEFPTLNQKSFVPMNENINNLLNNRKLNNQQKQQQPKL